MPGADKLLLRLMLERALHHKKAQSFEDFFVRAGIVMWKADFEPWKAQGNLGDFKCDGYLVSQQTVFQCNAPETFIASKVTTKINRDYEGARDNFGSKMRRWVFVHNQLSLPSTAGMRVTTLRERNPEIAIEIWSPEYLVNMLMGLPEAELRHLFPDLAEDQSFSEATIQFLRESVQAGQPPIPPQAPGLVAPNRLPLDDILDGLAQCDSDVRRRILGYAHIFDPAKKSIIVERLRAQGFREAVIEINARRLHEQGLIEITENYYLCRDKAICQQAVDSVLEEIAQELDD